MNLRLGERRAALPNYRILRLSRRMKKNGLSPVHTSTLPIRTTRTRDAFGMHNSAYDRIDIVTLPEEFLPPHVSGQETEMEIKMHLPQKFRGGPTVKTSYTSHFRYANRRMMKSQLGAKFGQYVISRGVPALLYGGI